MPKNVTEVDPKTGMYAAYKVSRETAAAILNWARSQGFSHIMRPSKMHVTTVYSRKFVPTYTPSNKPLGATFDHFKIFPEKDKTGFGTLVAVVHSPALVDRWATARRCGATHDFPDYVPHISLGRVPTTFKLKDLPPFDFPIVFSHEYSQLLSWGDGPHGYQIGNELMILSSDDAVKGTVLTLASFLHKIQAEADAAAIADRRKMRGTPVRTSLTHIPIFRACARTVTQFSPMAYVTTRRQFAVEHADHQAAVEGENYHVLKATVKAADVYNALNPGEFFYDGPAVRGTPIYVAEAD